jgi:hypothetical protein
MAPFRPLVEIQVSNFILKYEYGIKIFIFSSNLFCCHFLFSIFSDTNARNERHLAALHYSKTGSFEVIHGLLDRVMELLDVSFTKDGNGYYIKAHDG